MNPEKYDKFLKELNDIESICLERAKQKMELQEIGYGKHNYNESINFETNRVRMSFINIHHDYRETTEVSLTKKQILMSDTEWNDCIQKIIETKNKKQRTKKEITEIQEKEERRKKYEELKEEFK